MKCSQVDIAVRVKKGKFIVRVDSNRVKRGEKEVRERYIGI